MDIIRIRDIPRCANCGLPLDMEESAPTHEDGYVECPPGFATSAAREIGS